MISRPILIGICLGWLVASANPLEAQFRRFGTRPGQRRQGSGLNPIHERTKTGAEQAYQRGDYQRAIDLTSSVLRANSRDDVAYYLRSSSRVELGLQQRNRKIVRDGIADSREALRLKGRENPIYYIPYLYGMTGLATLENRKEHAEIAVKFAGQAIGTGGLKSEDKAHLLYQRARARAFLQDYDNAIFDFKEAVRLLPTQLGFQMDLADAYAKSGRMDEATTVYKRTIDAFPNEPLVYNNRGMLLQQSGDVETSIEDFSRALQLNPKYFYAYTNRGFTLLKSDDPAAAENDFTASLRINPQQAMVYGFRATARLQQGKVQEAIADHQQALKMVPQNPLAHADLGFARFFAEDYAGALQSFDRAIALDPKLRYLNPWRYLATELDDGAAVVKSKFAEQIEPNAEKRDWIGHLLAYLSGQIGNEELIESLSDTKAEITNAQRCEAHFFIGRREATEGQSDEAAKHFRLAIETKAKQLSAFRGAAFALEKITVAEASLID